jgi:hypothetical protein
MIQASREKKDLSIYYVMLHNKRHHTNTPSHFNTRIGLYGLASFQFLTHTLFQALLFTFAGGVIHSYFYAANGLLDCWFYYWNEIRLGCNHL